MLFQFTCKYCHMAFEARLTSQGNPPRFCCMTCRNRSRTKPLAERFWPSVDTSGGPEACWPWKGCRKPAGYGLVRDSGRTIVAHHAAFFLTHGRWPDSLVCHRCDNPPCCNPAHLFEGTQAQNMEDMKAKGRGRGHTAYGEENPAAKFREDDIRKMRQLAAAGHTYAAIGRQFGVDSYTVSRIVRRLRWAHVS